MVDFLVRKPSKIHGLGVFTSKVILKGDVFYEVPNDDILHYAKGGCVYIGNNTWVSDKFVLNYVNHSCDPNTILDISGDIPKLIAARNIKENKEITVDYDETEKDGTLILCDCKSKKCKGKFATILQPGDDSNVLPDDR